MRHNINFVPSLNMWRGNTWNKKGQHSSRTFASQYDANEWALIQSKSIKRI